MKTQLVSQLIQAIMENDVGRVKTCLEEGADPNGHEDNYLMRPLHVAAINNAYECAELLLNHHADVMSKTADGQTPLDYAQVSKHSPLVDLLEKAVLATGQVQSGEDN